MKKIIRRIMILTAFMVVLWAQSAMAGWVTRGSTKVYVDGSGNRLESSYFASKGYGFVKIGSYWYCYSSEGVRKTGWKKVNGKKYYFKKKNGIMIQGRTARLKKKYYYFDASGVMLKNTWYLGYYYSASGARLVSTQKTFDGVTYTFDSTGNATGVTSTGTSVDAGYASDPAVTDEVLLSAIIYTESGNQPYYGQLAVGLVITNRMRSSLFPDTLKEVIYAKGQFQPARTGVLSAVLNNQSVITASCKKAAKKVLRMYAANKYKITVNGSKISMKGYYFFMTPSSYSYLGLTAPYITLQGHVFFKNWA